MPRMSSMFPFMRTARLLVLAPWVLVAMLLLPSASSAACTDIGYVQSRSLYLEISDGGCGELAVVFTRKIRANGQADLSTLQSYPFHQECVWNEGGGTSARLHCHAKGNTPLAGASYRRRAAGYASFQCGKERGSVREKRFEYVCFKGCNRPGVPQILSERFSCE